MFASLYRRASRRAWLAAAPLAAALLAAPAIVTADHLQAHTHLRVVGGLAGLNQFTRHEEPFWGRELARISGGRASAEIVPFDRAGIRSQEMLRLVQLGAIPFGTVLMAMADLDLQAADLAGLHPDMASMRRAVAAFRPYLVRTLRERYGVEALAVYAYPAQVTFCKTPLSSLSQLAGRRVRVATASQADWASAFGATPVQTGFAEIVPNLRAGNVDCAITGTMSGHTIGLHELTTHLHSSRVSWGLSVFVANGGAWNALPPDVQAMLKRELPRLEQAIWAEAEAETGEGIACNTGAAPCGRGRRGSMVEVRETEAESQRRREVLVRHVLPAWLQRCGSTCRTAWRETLGPALALELP